MKLRKKIIFVLAFAFGVVYVGLYLTLVLAGRPVLVNQIEKLTKRKASIASFGVTPLFQFNIGGLQVEGLAKAESASFAPDLLSLAGGNIVLNNVRLIRPELLYYRNPPATAGDDPKGPIAAPVAPVEHKKNFTGKVIIKRLKVRDGKVDFIDHTVSPEGITITVKDINLTLSSTFVFSRYPLINIAFTAKIPWDEGQEEGKIELDGWANFAKKDMQATLKITDIDGIYLYPYYAKWVDLDKARIEKAKLNFTSDIQGLNNNVTAQCHLELTDIVRKPLDEGQQEDKAAKVADQVLDIFKALNAGKVELNFIIRTKMDKPEFGLSSIRDAFEGQMQQAYDASFKPQDILLFPSKLWEKGVQYGTDISRAVFKGAAAVGSEIKKSVETASKKEPEPDKPQ